MIRKCVDCGDQFELTQGEIDFYVQNNLNLPKRCKTCRKEKRELGFFDGYSSSLNTKAHTKGRTVSQQSGSVSLISHVFLDENTPRFDPLAYTSDYSEASPTVAEVIDSIDTTPQYGDRLWYVNKKTKRIEYVLFVSLSEANLTINYHDKLYSLPSTALGTRLFLTRLGAEKCKKASS